RSQHSMLPPCASSEPIACTNIDCPWLYERTKAEQKLDFLEGLRTLIEYL
ncbi:hypothetical protein EV363DRAFT_1163261, partial [Boletus edulis]